MEDYYGKYLLVANTTLKYANNFCYFIEQQSVRYENSANSKHATFLRWENKIFYIQGEWDWAVHWESVKREILN